MSRIKRLLSLSNERALNFFLYFDNPLIHTSVMFRKRVIDQVGYYETDLSRQPPEDYELWLRVSRHWKLKNLPTPLVKYRILSNSFSRSKTDAFPNLTKLSAEYISDKLNIPFTQAHNLASAYKFQTKLSFFDTLKLLLLISKIAYKEKYCGTIYYSFCKIIIKRFLK